LHFPRPNHLGMSRSVHFSPLVEIICQSDTLLVFSTNFIERIGVKRGIFRGAMKFTSLVAFVLAEMVYAYGHSFRFARCAQFARTVRHRRREAEVPQGCRDYPLESASRRTGKQRSESPLAKRSRCARFTRNASAGTDAERRFIRC